MTSVNGARNAHIFALRRRGWKLQEIGERFGISRERVRQIVWKEENLRKKELRRKQELMRRQ